MVGAAMGFIISEPVPVENMIGIKARIVVIVVIAAGLILSMPPSKTVFRISSTVFGAFSLKRGTLLFFPDPFFSTKMSEYFL